MKRLILILSMLLLAASVPAHGLVADAAEVDRRQPESL